MPKKALFAEQRFYQKTKFWWIVVGLLFLAVYLIAYRGEIGTILAYLGYSFGGALPVQSISALMRDLAVLFFTLVMLVGSFIFFLLLASQFVLPVITNQERRRVFSRLGSYIVGEHGPAIFIKEAKEKAREEELKKSKPGVAFVDLCSAVALEQNHIPSGNGGALAADAEPPVRILGPGIVFTESGERIQGVADLRRQFRLTNNVSVSTRDGFEIRAPVWVLFTLGEQADILPVTYVDGMQAQNLRRIAINPTTQVVEGFEDELDMLDKMEIHNYVLNPWDAPLENPEPGILPYLFFPGRVFAALYSKARNLADGTAVDWSDLPSRVAIETFRDMLSQEDYNNLFLPEDPDVYPYFDVFQQRFNQTLRSQGVLGFKYVSRIDGAPIAVGDVVNGVTMAIGPRTRLQGNKILRDCGIKVIAAGFPELTPIHQGVRGQLVEYWKASWQQAANLTEATAAAEAMQIHTLARMQSQSELADSLQQIINLPIDSKAVIALRVMQTLETAAADPKTRALLSKDTLASLKNLQEIIK